MASPQPALPGLPGQVRARGITTTTIGFGRDFDENLLRAMADAGGGAAYYIENPDQAPGIFAPATPGSPAWRSWSSSWKTPAPAPSSPWPTSGWRATCLPKRAGSSTGWWSCPCGWRWGRGPGSTPRSGGWGCSWTPPRPGSGPSGGGWKETSGGAGEVLRESANQLAQALPGDPEAEREAAELEDLASRLEEERFVAEDVKYMKQRSYDVGRSKDLASEGYRRG